MQSSFRTLHLALASSVAVAFIVSAYVFSGPFSFRPSTVDAATAESLLKAYATKDSDTDGLPDWQESLYGTDPANPESVQTGVKDGDAVAQGLIKPKFASAANPNSDDGEGNGKTVADDTLTAEFARDFFTQYFSTYSNQTQPTEDQINSFTESAVQELVAKNQYEPTISASSLTVSGSGALALTAYLASVESALSKNTVPTSKSELDYMDDSIQRNDTSGLVQVRSIAKAYTAMGTAVSKVAVPAEAKEAHLALSNAMIHMGTVINHMGASDTDPIRSLLGLMLYQDAAIRLSDSLESLYQVLQTNGVLLQEGDPGYSVYKTAKYSASRIK